MANPTFLPQGFASRRSDGYGSFSRNLTNPYQSQGRLELARSGRSPHFKAAALDKPIQITKDLKLLRGRYRIKDAVGTTNRNDYFKFELDSQTRLKLYLNSSSDDVNLNLYIQNTNGDLKKIGKSSQSGKPTRTLARSTLGTGTYFLQVEFTGKANASYDLVAIADTAGNSLNEARNLGALGETQSFSDYVGIADKDDYYQFQITSPSNFGVAIDQISTDTNLSVDLYQDINGDGKLDSTENLGNAISDRTSSAALSASLFAGTYYLHVTTTEGNTNYSLHAFAASVTVPDDNAGNTLWQARNLGIASATKSYSDFVGTFDKDDYYRVDLKTISRLKITLDGLSSDADLRLIQDRNNNGQVESDLGEVLEYPFIDGAVAETIDTGLAAGTYYIDVSQYAGDTTYQLSVSSTPIKLPTGYSPVSGYGLVDAAAAIAKATKSAPLPPVTNLGGLNWDLDLINAPEVWQKGYTGKNVIVAVVDSGVDYNHYDLKNNIWSNADELPDNGIDDDNNGFIDDVRGWNFLDETNSVGDLYGHGTHIAGTIAASKNKAGTTGVAYDAKIMPVKVLDDAFGDGTEASISGGIRYAVDNGADIINISISGAYSPDIESAIQYAVEKGVFLAIASGNKSARYPDYPAQEADQYGVAVGAIDRDRKLAKSSNNAGYTPLKYVVAPGVDIYSTAPQNTFQFLSGTSMATPHVAGIAALLLSAKPELKPTEIANLLVTTANMTGITDT